MNRIPYVHPHGLCAGPVTVAPNANGFPLLNEHEPEIPVTEPAPLVLNASGVFVSHVRKKVRSPFHQPGSVEKLNRNTTPFSGTWDYSEVD